ncbi:MAG: methyltransferase-like protein [Ramlibacter sp.]|jgi:16S rRNA (guanine966-N2)-methyltransferase|nr:methyltransferase-like protein [Ramlibacter sp.]
MPRTAPHPRKSLPNQVRIIGGVWKRTRLEVADRPGLRPTPDRVRETLFNWLGQDLSGWRCVDAFAGTGALGLEAASRGAEDVLLVESEGQLVDKLRAVIERLDATNVRVQRGNALSVLATLSPRSVDLVFIDPPFESELSDKALAAARPSLKDEGLIYLEVPQALVGEALERHGLELVRHMKAGQVHSHLLRRVA